MKKIKLVLCLVALAGFMTMAYSQETGSFTDSRDGKVYKTVKIGDQWWMSENLAYYAGDECKIYESIEGFLETYGYLYPYETAKVACPDGWHLPSDAEYEKLSRFLGGEYEAGGKLKEVGTAHWKHPNTGATNSSGFTARSAGMHGPPSYTVYVGMMAYFWSYDETVEDTELGRALYFNKNDFTRYIMAREDPLSVRCLKDE